MNYTYRAYSVEEATKILEKYCAYQERCHQEVRIKLRKMRMISEAVDQIIVHLIERDYLNEGRFASAFVRGKFKNKDWGRIRLRYELDKREITKYNIEKALKEIDETDYNDSFNGLVEKKWDQLSSIQDIRKRKRKLIDYLQYRGWENSLIYDSLAKLK